MALNPPVWLYSNLNRPVALEQEDPHFHTTTTTFTVKQYVRKEDLSIPQTDIDIERAESSIAV